VTLISIVGVECVLAIRLSKNSRRHKNACCLFLTCGVEGGSDREADVVEGERRIIVREWSTGQVVTE
jgi:hypothetical protein